MKILLFLLFVCELRHGWAATVNCDALIQKYRQCQDTIRSNRQAEADQQLNAKPDAEKCFLINSCQPLTPPSKPGDQSEKRSQCRKEVSDSLKGKVQECVRKTSPGFSFPQNKEQQPRSQKPFKPNRKEIEKACDGSTDKAKAVESCLKQVHNAPTLTEQQKRDRFEKNCQERKKCDNELGNCRPQFEKLKTTICQCTRDVRTEENISQARKRAPSCNGLPQPKLGKKKEVDQTSCDQLKDWCAEGYDAWKKYQQQQRKKGDGQQ